MKLIALPQVEEFAGLPTYGTWLPMACTDIHGLKPYSQLYAEPCPDDLVIRNSGGPYFFQNHPINYVVLTAKCVHVVDTYYRDSGKYVYTFFLDDETGNTAVAQIIRFSPDSSNMQFNQKYVQVKGHVYTWHGVNQVSVRNIRELKPQQHPVRTCPFEQFLLASQEVYLVRQEVLRKQWKPDGVRMIPKSADVNDDPIRYCSFSRVPSCLEKSQLFRESVHDIDRVADTQFDEPESPPRVVEIDGDIIELGMSKPDKRHLVCEVTDPIEMLPLATRHTKRENLLRIHHMPADKHFQVIHETDCAMPECGHTPLPPLVESFIEGLAQDCRHPSERRAQLPDDDYSNAALRILRPKLAKPSNNLMRYETLEEVLLDKNGEERQLYSEFVSCLEHVLNEELLFSRHQLHVWNAIQDMAKQEWTNLVCFSTSDTNRVYYTHAMVRFICDMMFMARCEEHWANLAQLMADPESVLFEPVPNALIKRFFKNGLRELCRDGKLVKRGYYYYLRRCEKIRKALTVG